MAFVLNDIQLRKGLQRQTALLLSSLRWAASISPFSIDALRTALEQDQTQPFEDLEFNIFLSNLYNLSLDYAELTQAEIAIINEIRVYLNPPIGIIYCGEATPTLDLVEKSFIPRSNSITHEYEARLSCDPSVLCDIKRVDLTMTPVGEAPSPIGSPYYLYTLGSIGGKQIFVKNWINFVSDPTSQDYNLQYDFINSVGTSIALLNYSVTF